MKKLKITFNSPVVLIFVFACFVVTLLGAITGGLRASRPTTHDKKFCTNL